MIKIYYPTKLPITNWYYYLLHGFEELRDIEIILSPELKKIGYKPMAIDIEVDGRKTRCWYDVEDSCTIFPEVSEKENNLYFKIAYSKMIKYPKNVVPIPQTASYLIRRYLNELRNLKRKKKYKYDIVGYFRLTNFTQRLKIVELLRKQPLKSKLYLIKHTKQNIDRVPKEMLLEKRIPHLEYWKLLTQAKINLDITGFKGNISWRKADIMAIGGFCLTENADRILTAPNNFHWEEYKSLLLTRWYYKSDLLDKIYWYLEHDEEREVIAKRGMKYYKEFLSPKAQAQYMINKVKENL